MRGYVTEAGEWFVGGLKSVVLGNAGVAAEWLRTNILQKQSIRKNLLPAAEKTPPMTQIIRVGDHLSPLVAIIVEVDIVYVTIPEFTAPWTIYRPKSAIDMGNQ